MIIALGVVAFVLAWMLSVPPSRDLVLKLGTLVDMAQRADPERFRRELEPISPFAGKAFKHHRIGRFLRADVSAFGELCERLQREARALDRRAHRGVVPVALYAAGLALWYWLQP